jgi:hypothetical protein
MEVYLARVGVESALSSKRTADEWRTMVRSVEQWRSEDELETLASGVRRTRGEEMDFNAFQDCLSILYNVYKKAIRIDRVWRCLCSGLGGDGQRRTAAGSLPAESGRTCGSAGESGQPRASMPQRGRHALSARLAVLLSLLCPLAVDEGSCSGGGERRGEGAKEGRRICATHALNTSGP